MSTILSSQVTLLSAKRKWCWAKTGPLQASSDSKQGGFCALSERALFSIPWTSSKMLHAVLCLMPPKGTPEEDKWQRISRSPGELWYSAAPTTWLSLSPAEGSTGTSTIPHNRPSPSVLLGHHFPVCSLHVRLVWWICWGGPQRPCSQKFSSFQHCKSKLAPTAVVGSDQFNSHANKSGGLIIGELRAI